MLREELQQRPPIVAVKQRGTRREIPPVTRRRRQYLLALLTALLLVLGGVVVVQLWHEGEEQESESAEAEELPPALERHLEKLREAVPGHGGEPSEGPGSAGDAEFLKRAYPGDTIALAEVERSRTSFSNAKARPFPTGKGQQGSWVSIGPDQALYPDTPFRNSFSYVPNDYIAGGRTTSIAIGPSCDATACTMYITPAGGGIWRTKNALADQPKWDYLGGPLGINAAGAVTVDRSDPTGSTVYVGTGEANICGSGCVAGVGLYKSTNGGTSWTGPLGKAELGGKGIGDIVIKPGDPNTLYVGTTTALRGMSSVCCSGVTRPVPDAAKWGLYKSTDGGASWSFIHNGSANAADCTGSLAEFQNAATCSPRGVRSLALDPSNPEIVYAASYARGVWRSPDGGATWAQIKPSLNAAVIQTRPNIAVTKLPNGKTRMYVYEGNAGQDYSRLFRSDDVATGVPVFSDLTSPSTASPGYATFNQCDGQCWYDAFVYTPKGQPDMVYSGGSYSYGETIANKRAVVLSMDAGVSGTDMTFDGTDQLHPNGLHPDQHDIVTNPSTPLQFFETNDGGVMRSSGELVDRSSWCDDPNRGLTGADKTRCQQMLSAIPSKLDGINDGLLTLQFMKVKASPHKATLLTGGTQDNGTWETPGNPVKWENTMIGDGGWNGFDVELPDFRFHSFFDTSPEVNFEGGNIATWIWIADPVFGTGGQFYSPIISDPKMTKWMFAGSSNVWRTKTHGLGAMTYDEAQ